MRKNIFKVSAGMIFILYVQLEISNLDDVSHRFQSV
jgi:hypothetical protein